ncbi:putative small T antigen [Bandicoot papillomatosis carcinomatosis virus type 1]|uniref:Putative small T antigen n=1 Tax=Bandicoot papillomatosis carcinomatosis virus type 1 TaxID=479058 RepID=A9QH33_9PAPI|nr:putative small T antigen [Bandicoot papillomatosis carcinomatosis virus type 1]ABW76698.1 putative small T antigen [Bandicoot papillomatosis carcinomatosis virus type 1]
MDNSDYLEFLKLIGCDTCDGPENIKKSYRKAALKMHPDKGGSTNAMKRLNELNQSYLEYGPPQNKRYRPTPQYEEDLFCYESEGDDEPDTCSYNRSDSGFSEGTCPTPDPSGFSASNVSFHQSCKNVKLLLDITETLGHGRNCAHTLEAIDKNNRMDWELFDTFCSTPGNHHLTLMFIDHCYMKLKDWQWSLMNFVNYGPPYLEEIKEAANGIDWSELDDMIFS